MIYGSIARKKIRRWIYTTILKPIITYAVIICTYRTKLGTTVKGSHKLQKLVILPELTPLHFSRGVGKKMTLSQGGIPNY